MSVSNDDRCDRERNCLLVMAPVSRPICANLLARIFSNVLSRHDISELARMFLGSVVSVRPGLGMGTHLAYFHCAGNALWKRRLVDIDESSSGLVRWTAVTVL